MPQTALITGASGGIGLAFAHKFAQNGYNVILVARSVAKLEALAAELNEKYHVKTLVIDADLTTQAAPRAIVEAIREEDWQVDVLVNNAGFGSYGLFHEQETAAELNIIELNVMALVHLTHLLLPDMVSRRRGKILNVASTAAFMPGPLMAVYYASKAFVLSFSEAIGNELKGTGVTVTVLCPGPTKSDFQARAAMTDSKLVQGNLMSVDEVVAAGYTATIQEKVLVIPGVTNRIQASLPRFFPRWLITRLVRNAQARTGH